MACARGTVAGRMSHHPFFAALLCCGALLAQQTAPQQNGAPPRAVQGRVEDHGGLKLLRIWGTPAERGYAHGHLLGTEIAAVATAEFTARFARQQPLLKQVRGAVDRLIEYPEDVQAEIEALYAGLVDSKANLHMVELERDFDLKDLLVANALDVFGLLGCSSFTLWGEQVEGGGVLAGRNFDWPLTGAHMVDATMLVVEHLPDGRAVASVGWPGYVGAVTGVSSDGLAAFLHVGSAEVTFTPEPESWPSAIATRVLLERCKAADGEAVFAECKRLLGYTSPPAGYLSHVVLPRAADKAAPFAVFETDSKSCVAAERAPGASVLTNHFLTRADGRPASKDSVDREKRVRRGIDGCLGEGDKRVSIDEAWELLRSVQRGGVHAFGTLHSVVFRHEPWCFELRVASMDGKKIVAAPDSTRRHSLTRKELFATDEKLGEKLGK